MIQRIIVEEVSRDVSLGEQIRAVHVLMQKDLGKFRVWCRLEPNDVVEIVRICVHPVLSYGEVSSFAAYIKELKPVGPSAEMNKWSGGTTISENTRWYVEVVIPSTTE